MKPITKICNVCKTEKSLTEFYYRKERGEYRSNCKKCKPLVSKSDMAAKANAPTKVCKHCGQEKPASEYNKAGGGKWSQPYCKPCDAERKRKYTDKNRIGIKEKRKKYYEENKCVILEKQKSYIEKNKDAVKERIKKYSLKNLEKKRQAAREYGRANREAISKKSKERRASNPEYYKAKAAALRAKRTPEQKAKLKEQQRLWRVGNKDKIKAQRQKQEVKERTRERNRINSNIKAATDISFNILKRLRGRTRFALKKWNTVKSDTTENLLGCTIPFFKEYFSSLFTEGMSWELFLSGEIHVEHKKPCSKFDLRNEDEQRACFHYTNLQPMFKLDNLRKGTFYQEEKVA